MSNLQLPSLSYKALDDMLPPLKEGALWGPTKKIGYNTFARRDGAQIEIVHHSTVIATIGIWSVSITPHGYVSSTTANRISKVMVDNGLWPSYFTVAIRNFEYRVLTPGNMRKGEPFNDRGETFKMIAGIWEHVPRTASALLI